MPLGAPGLWHCGARWGSLVSLWDGAGIPAWWLGLGSPAVGGPSAGFWDAGRVQGDRDVRVVGGVQQVTSAVHWATQIRAAAYGWQELFAQKKAGPWPRSHPHLSLPSPRGLRARVGVRDGETGVQWASG